MTPERCVTLLGAPCRLAAAPPVTASANAAVQHPAGVSGSGLAAGMSQGSGPFDAAQPPAMRGLAFDPLARRRGAATKGTAGVAARLDAGTSSGGQEVDILAQGLSQLLAELASHSFLHLATSGKRRHPEVRFALRVFFSTQDAVLVCRASTQ